MKVWLIANSFNSQGLWVFWLISTELRNIIIIIIIIYSLWVFLHQVLFWSLRDSKFPQVSRSLLSILAILNNAVVWMVSACHWFLTLPAPLTNHLEKYSKCTNYNWYHHHVHVPLYFSVFWRGLSTCFSFYFLWSVRMAKSTIWQALFFLLIITMSSFLTWIWWFACFSKIPENFVSHSLEWILVCAYTIC